MTGFEFSYTVIWMVLAILLIIAEALTMGLTTIWFAIGALAALLAAALKLNVVVQVTVFLVVSVVSLVYTRPVALRVLKVGSTKTNAASLVGEHGVITKAIEPFSTGQAKVKGQIWTVVGQTQETHMETGMEVEVIQIDGVKLKVKPLKTVKDEGGE